MAEEPKLSPAGEEAWSSLLRRLEWAEGFALIFLFSSSSALLKLLHDRLRRIYQVKASYVEEIAPHSPENAVGEIMSVVAASSDLDRSSRAPLFIALYEGRSAAWDEARANFLQRLNERREILRNNLRRPVIIALPADFRQAVIRLAPDLWSIRDLGLDLDAAIEAPAPEGRQLEIRERVIYLRAALSKWLSLPNGNGSPPRTPTGRTFSTQDGKR